MPSVAWRIAMLLGADVGPIAALYRTPDAVGYVLGLEAAQVLAAVCFFGLTRPWSEVWPAWVPGLGGRSIPRVVPGVLGIIGAVVLLLIMGALLAQFFGSWFGTTGDWTPDLGMNPVQRVVLLICYVPFFAWPVATAAAVVAFWTRRR